MEHITTKQVIVPNLGKFHLICFLLWPFFLPEKNWTRRFFSFWSSNQNLPARWSTTIFLGRFYPCDAVDGNQKSGEQDLLKVGSLSHYLQRFLYARWCRISSINSIISIYPFTLTPENDRMSCKKEPLCTKFTRFLTSQVVQAFFHQPFWGSDLGPGMMYLPTKWGAI